MATPAWQGPWFSADSPWNTAVPSGCPVHPDNTSMTQGYYIGNPSTSYDIHAFAYQPEQMQIKEGGGTTYNRDVKWCGPGQQENIIFSPSTQAKITVWIDVPSYKASSVQVPMPFNWTGYNQPWDVTTAYYERRTTVICENGDLYFLYGVTPPGHPIRDNSAATDTDWHASSVFYAATASGQGWKFGYPYWLSGGSGFPSLCGTITPFDILNTPTGGHFNHALAFNASWNADGSFAGHPKYVWPAAFIVYGVKPNSDGKTQTAVGIPYGARIFLDPTLSNSDLIALGITKEWQLQIARTLQVYGGIAKESVAGQGAAGGLISESIESIAWNISQHYYPAGFQWPWIADGTTDNSDRDTTTYNAALPFAAVPNNSTSHWKVANWNQDVPGITAPASSGGGGGGGSGGAITYVKEVAHNNTISNPGSTAVVAVSAGPSAGNLLILSAAMNLAGCVLSSVTDSKSNTWTVDQTDSNSLTNDTINVASTVQDGGTLTTSDSITLHFSSALSPGKAAVAVHEFSGTSNTVDKKVAQATTGSTGTARDAGTLATTTHANDLVWAAWGVINAETSLAPAAGYTSPATSFYANGTSISVEFAYQVVSTTGAYHPTATGGVAARSIGVAVAYQSTAASAPTNLTPPNATGTAVVGSVVSTTDGVWSDDGTGTITYQWQRDSSGDSNYSNISSATASSYTLVSADANCNVRCAVTDTDGSGATTAFSNSVGIVATTPFPPANTVSPAVTGTPTVGSVLTCSTGTWTDDGSPTFTYQWQSGTIGNLNPIDGATSSTYTLTSGEDGLQVQCFVTDTDSHGSTTVPSNIVSVTYAAAANTVAPSLSGSPQVGSTVSVNVGTWTPTGAETFTYQWQDSPNGTTGWANINGATSPSYVIGAAEQGKYLRCVVTGVTDGG